MSAKSCVADDVVSRNVGVTGIDASARGHELRQQIQQLGNLLEVAAERKLRASGILDQNSQIAARQIEAVRTACSMASAARCKPSSRLPPRNDPGCSTRNSAHKRQRALDFAAKRRDRLGMKFGIAARQVDQVVGVNHQRLADHTSRAGAPSRRIASSASS